MGKKNYDRMILVDRFGNVKDEVKEAILSKMKEDMDFVDYLNAKEDLEDKISEYAVKNELQHQRHGMKTSSIVSMIAEDKMQKMFINAGVEAETLAKKSGASVEDILNPANWKSVDGESVFRSGEIAYTLSFNYKKRSNWTPYIPKKKEKGED